MQGQINDAKSSMKSIVFSGALSGKVKGAIDAKVSNHQIPLLTSYYDTLTMLNSEFDKLIQNFKSTVKESNDHALIDSDELTQLEAKFSPKLTEFTQIETDFKNAYTDISGIVAIEKASGSEFKEEMEKTKKVLTNTKTWMASFKGSSNSIAESISRQSAQMGKLSSTSGVSYTSPEALTIFQDKAFKKQVSKDHKKAKELEKNKFKRDHPVLAAMNGNMTKADLDKIDKMINSSSLTFVKNGNKYVKYGKRIYIGRRLSKLSDGTLIVKGSNKFTKKLDKLTGIDDWVKDGKSFSRLSSSGGLKKLTKSGKAALKEIQLFDEASIFKSASGRIKEITKSNLKAAGKATVKTAIKKASFGVTGILDDIKGLKNAKGIGKAMPGLNLVAGAIEVGQGVSKSEKQARKEGLKRNQITASKVGGVAVDALKVGATTAVVGAVTSVAVAASLPVVGIAAAGVAASVVADWAIKKTGVDKKLKSGVNSLIKGASRWFK
ncbi:hypothetical protein RV07_GL002694 [Enterococcus malodoratus]|nr:hypothetical protein RV07_GL002694 [Enterococcus malodoratus]